MGVIEWVDWDYNINNVYLKTIKVLFLIMEFQKLNMTRYSTLC